MSKHNDVSTVEHAKGRKSGGGFKRHCARKWWIYLIAFIVIALAVVLGIIFGALPKLAQKSINKSTLEVEGVSITKPQENRFVYGQNSTVHSHVPVSASMGDQRIAMFLPKDGEEPVPFMYLNVSSLQLADEFKIDVDNYDMEIVNAEAFLEFTNKVMAEKEVTLGLKSRPEIKTGSLKNYVNYEKRVTLKGFNKLEGIYLQNGQILETPEDDGVNMLAELFISNPSSFELEVGDLSCSFSSHILGELGTGLIENLIIHRGDNLVKVRATLLEKQYKDNAKILKYTAEQGGVNLTVTGNSTIYNGNHIPWLEGPLGAIPLEVPLKGTKQKNSTSS